jgi:transcriptional regulator with XRE-family HTH domain
MPQLHGALVAALRKTEVGTQEVFAQRSGLSRRYIQEVEAGKVVSHKTFLKVAEVLRVMPPSLLLLDSQTQFEDLVRHTSGTYQLKSQVESSAPSEPPLDTSRYLQLLDEDQSKGDSYATFTTMTREHYLERMRKTGVTQLTLEQLLHSAGAPPNTADGDTELVHWPKRMLPQLTKEQKTLWEFVTAIYPARGEKLIGDVTDFSSIRPTKRAKVFHDARRELAKHFDRWYAIAGWPVFAERFMTRCDEVLLVAWLDLALVQWTRGAGMHKQGLYRLAKHFERSITLRKQGPNAQ